MLDRQAIAETLEYGLTTVADTLPTRDEPLYAEVQQRGLASYPYDLARADRLLGEAGWTKGADGVARSVAGEPLHIPILNQSLEVDQLEAAIVADYWKAIGVSSEIQRLSRAQQTDGEFRTKFAAVAYNRRPLGYDTMGWLNIGIPTPANRWSGENNAGYVNPTLEELWPRVLATVDDKERERLLVESLKAMTADAVVNPTHLQPRAMAYRAGLVGPKEPWVGESALIWNAWEWHWRG
jgi:peptide/nickel transport system substrate-binding protein